MSLNNIWGDTEQLPLFGDLYVEIDINIPEKVEIIDNNITQQIEIPLYKILSKGEKIRVATIFDKKYDAEINDPRILNDLKFVLPGEGILNEMNQLGNYIIKFDILAPDLDSLKKQDRDTLLALLCDI